MPTSLTSLTAEDEAAAIKRLKDVDVLVLDLSLPKVSGVEVLRRVREAHRR